VARIIPFPAPARSDNLLAAEPFCFRRADWAPREAAQVWRPEAEVYQAKRREALKLGRPLAFTPSHVSLKGSLSQTTRALFQHRVEEPTMRRVYFLCGLMELATGLSHEVLRTDLVRRVFELVEATSGQLNLRWPASAEGFLLPLTAQLQPRNLLRENLSRAATLKELLDSLRAETDRQFDLAGRLFVYYLPPAWTG